ncbi:MAG TPA: hypothetical protein DHW07_07140 [Gammaproteobacteria bacterium]|nr:hypothetical protein [Gammaproteobacteria bacterium]|tara:strand:+ start:1128 stop:1472 length:345 start_codon:yes stop_codon:yes gene_type:complete
MSRKKFIAIHTYHSEETKSRFWSGVKGWERTDTEWRDMYIVDKCQCTAVWVGSDDFFFCQWESESEEDVHDTLSKIGADDYIFTALYQIDMHIDVNNLTGKNPYGGITYLDTGS